jgi:type IV pilus assembly protein PilO
MALTAKERQQVLGLAIVVALAAGAVFWMYWRTPTVERIAVVRDSLETLNAEVTTARRDLARGTVENLQERIQYYEATLERLRALAPDPNEVTTLIDDISARARQRGVEIGELAPLTVEQLDAFEVHRYRFTVYGHYNDIGAFLSDIASLPRVMVPADLSLTPADAISQRTYGDTTGALIQAQFQLRTFVKPVGGGGGAGGNR